MLAGFGWARPVPVNARNLRRPVRDMACVAAAGPLSNFALAFVGLVLLVLTSRLVESPFVARPVAGMLRYVYTFNLGLAIFNLIPLPPLDGGHFLPYFFPRRSWPLLARLEQYGPLILLLLVFSGATRYIVGPLFGLVNAPLPHGAARAPLGRDGGRRPAPSGPEKTKGPDLAIRALRGKNPGDDLLSRAATSTVPSALEGLTSVFGMGTGVAPPVRPPGIGKPHTRSSRAVTSNQDWKEANPRSSRTAD